MPTENNTLFYTFFGTARPGRAKRLTNAEMAVRWQVMQVEALSLIDKFNQGAHPGIVVDNPGWAQCVCFETTDPKLPVELLKIKNSLLQQWDSRSQYEAVIARYKGLKPSRSAP